MTVFRKSRYFLLIHSLRMFFRFDLPEKTSLGWSIFGSTSKTCFVWLTLSSKSGYNSCTRSRKWSRSCRLLNPGHIHLPIAVVLIRNVSRSNMIWFIWELRIRKRIQALQTSRFGIRNFIISPPIELPDLPQTTVGHMRSISWYHTQISSEAWMSTSRFTSSL